MEEQEFSEIQTGSREFSKPDKKITLKNQSLELAHIIYQEKIDDTQEFFFKQADPSSPGNPHLLIFCQRNLVRVYSISPDRGIQLESHHQIPEDFNKAKKHQILLCQREFVYGAQNHQLIILNGDRYCGSIVDFVVLDLKKTSKEPSLRALRPKSEILRYSAHILMNHSPRIYTRYMLLELNSMQITESYLTPQDKCTKPRTRFLRFNDQSLKNMFFSDMDRLNAQQKRF